MTAAGLLQFSVLNRVLLPPARRAATGAVLALVAAALPASATKRPAPKTVSLSDRLLAITRRTPILPRSEFAVAVQKVGDPQPLLLVNADRPLILASTTKIFTTAAALDRLGAEYKFRTRVFADAPVGPEGVLPGHLVIAGGGDPAISGRLFEDDPLAVFRPWVEAIKAKGIKVVRDGLVLDTSFFDDVRVHPDWPAEQEQHWWQAPVSALSYNDNVVLVRATGALRPGSPAMLGFYPAGPPLLELIGRVFTASGRGARVGVRRPAGSRTVLASGLVGRNRTWTGDVTVPDPPLYFAAAFSQVLRENGVELRGSPTVRTEPSETPPLLDGRTSVFTHETGIVPVISVCNKRSQSFFAEQILKTLGAEKRGRGTWENGEAEVSEFLKSLKIDPGKFHLVDGSGRSRNNTASAGAYIEFLNALATRWDKFETFRPTLAITGSWDGSLRHRMLGEATRGKVFAKTGNIAGVVTLSGYVQAQSGAWYAFSILINGGCPELRGHSWQDRFVTELARFG